MAKIKDLPKIENQPKKGRIKGKYAASKRTPYN